MKQPSSRARVLSEFGWLIGSLEASLVAVEWLGVLFFDSFYWQFIRSQYPSLVALGSCPTSPSQCVGQVLLALLLCGFNVAITMLYFWRRYRDVIGGASTMPRIGREVVVLVSLFVFSILAHFVTDVTASGNSAEKGPHHFDVSKLFATYAGSPVVEEYIFRVVLCSILASRSTNVAFISGVSSFLFSAIHLVNLFGNASGLYLAFQLAVAALVGATYSIIYLDSRSIVPTTILHILNNASSRALSPDQPQELLFTLGGLTQGAIIVAVGMYMASHAFAFLSIRSRLATKASVSQRGNEDKS